MQYRSGSWHCLLIAEALVLSCVACSDAEAPVASGGDAETADARVVEEAAVATYPLSEGDAKLGDVLGTFVRGKGGLWSEYLTFDQPGKFHRQFRGCVGGSGGASTAERDGDYLVLKDNRKAGEPSADGIRTTDRFLIVPWDTRVYLVPEGMILAFCNAVNAGAEPRSSELAGYFFVQQGLCETRPLGRPSLPDEWARLVLDQVVTGTTSPREPDGTTWVDIGSADGLTLGMEPLLRQMPNATNVIAMGAPTHGDQPLTILELEPTRCRVKFKWQHERRPPIPAGLSVTVGQDLENG